jgi:glucokinase
MDLALCLDVGGTKIAGALIDRKSNSRFGISIPTPIESTEATVAAIEKLIKDLLDKAKSIGKVKGIGVGIPGTVRYPEGFVVTAPNLPISNLPLKQLLEEKFKLLVRVDNDANLAVLGERYFGKARKCNDVVLLTLGTGIGSGLFLGGRLYRGSTGTGAELGHMIIKANGPLCSCGARGCFEVLASGVALERLAKDLVKSAKSSVLVELAEGKISKIEGSLIAKAARLGDKQALAAFAELSFWLGIGLANIANIFNPELILISGGLAEASDLLLEKAIKIMTEIALEPNGSMVKVEVAALGQKAGLIGAAVLVFQV